MTVHRLGRVGMDSFERFVMWLLFCLIFLVISAYGLWAATKPDTIIAAFATGVIGAVCGFISFCYALDAFRGR